MSFVDFDTELLAYFDGRLSPESALHVKKRLSRDPELLRLYEGMVRDRDLLRASLDRDSRGTTPNLVADAMAEAARAPATPAPVAPAPAPHRRLRIGPALGVAAAAALALLAVIVFWPAPRNADQLASAPQGPPAPESAATTRPSKPTGVFRAPEKTAPKESPKLPGLLAGDEATGITFAERDTATTLPAPIMTREEALRKAARDRELQKLFGPGGQIPGPGGEPRLTDGTRGGWSAGFEVGGMELGKAAELAVTRRLRIVVEASNPDAVRRRAGFSQDRTLDGALADGGSAQGPSEALSVNFPMDPELAGLQNALAQIAENIESEGDALVRFEEVPEGEEAADAARLAPSTALDDVIWWQLPSDRWMISSSVAVPIEFITPQASDEP